MQKHEERQDNKILSNLIKDLDSETAKMAAICGLGARLLYIDTDGQERIMNVPPWECIFVYDRSINEPQYALPILGVVDQNGETTERTLLGGTTKPVTFYIQDSEGNYILDDTEPIRPQFSPLILSQQRSWGAEKVLHLIDAYDRALSDQNNEIEGLYAFLRLLRLTRRRWQTSKGPVPLVYQRSRMVRGLNF